MAQWQRLRKMYIARHSRGDWGVVGAADKRANDPAVNDGTRSLSAYVLRDGATRIWIITEADRSATTILLANECLVATVDCCGLTPDNYGCMQMQCALGQIADTTVHMDASSMRRSAILSECRRYRYVLEREWQPDLPGVLFIALNPSTADGEHDDPTVRRCIGFAKSWGFGKLAIANLFALRSTDPSGLLRECDPIGLENDRWLSDLGDQFALTIAAWGAHTLVKDRATDVLEMLVNVHHLGLTNAGHPKHPLYLPKTTRPRRF